MSAELPGCHRYLNRIAPPPLVPVQLDRAAAAGLVQAGVPQSQRQHEGSYRTVHSGEGLAAGAREVRRARRGSIERKYQYRAGLGVCADGPAVSRGDARRGEQRTRVAHSCLWRRRRNSHRRRLGIRGAIAEVERLGAESGVFLPQQFANPDNAEAHRLGTAREVLDQIPGGRVDAVVSGVGTGGTLVGLFEGLRENGCPVVPVLAKPVDLERTPDAECCSFSMRIPGVADSISEIFKPDRLPGLVTMEVPDEDALATTRELIRLGFPVGPSSGLNYRAAIAMLRRWMTPLRRS